MEEKYNEPTHNRPDGERILDATMVNIPLPKYIWQIKEEEAWHKNDRNAITLFKSDKMNIVMIALHKNAQLKPHKAEGTLSVHVLEGNIKFATDTQAVTLVPGQIVTLHENVMHHVIANEESVFLLTMSK